MDAHGKSLSTDCTLPRTSPGSKPTATESYRIVTEPAGLAAIFEPHLSLIVHRRIQNPRSACLGKAARLVKAASWQANVSCPEPEYGFAVLSRWSLPGVLIRDIVSLIELLALITGAERMGVRLKTLDRQMCPRFHVDRVGIRLVSTYAGPGTEWLPGSGVEPKGLGRPLTGAERDGDPARRRGAQVLAAGPLDVVLMKGELWPGLAALPAVHRSPIVPAEQTRLVLTLDPLD